MSLHDWVKLGQEIGLDGIDISMMFLDNHTPVYLESIKEMLVEENINIIMAVTYPDFTHPKKLQRDRELEYLRHDIAICSELNIKYLRVLAGQAHPETSQKKGVLWATEYLKKASHISEKFNIQLVYEDHAKPSAWHYIDFSYPPDIFLEIFEGLKDTNIGINFDTGNISAYGLDPLTILQKIINIKEHGKFSPVAIGTGITPNKEIFRMLKKHGFSGWLCLEETTEPGKETIKNALAYVRRTWAEV